MKKIASLFLALLLVLSMFSGLSVNVQAVGTKTKDGLEVSITTDKSDYTCDEEIQISVNIKNINKYKVEDVSVETLLPEGLVLKSGTLLEEKIHIEAGESYSVSAVVELSDAFKEETEVETEVETEKETESETDATTKVENEQETLVPKTGDNSNLFLWCVLLIASVVGVILLVKHKRFSQMLSLFLCVTMTTAILPPDVWAEDSVFSTISVEDKITIDDKEYSISANVTYKKEISVLKPVIKLECDSLLTYDKENDRYLLSGVKDVLSGTLSNSKTVTSAYFEVVYNESVITTYSFDADKSWEVSEFGLMPGENILHFYMTDVNNNIWDQSVVIFCMSDDNIKTIIEDTESDKDSDELPDYIEELFGTDPNIDDTDGDGLSDGIEKDILGCDARKYDTDGDGTSDGEEDADGDGLSNYEEIKGKTDPCNYDTDNDGLNDFEEIQTYGTSPLKNDTDGDTLTDGWEVENDKNPLVADKTVSISDSLQSGESTAEVKLDLPSEMVQSFVITTAEEEILQTEMPGRLSAPVSLQVAGTLPETGATLRFSVSDTNPAGTTEIFEPVIYYFNPETEMLEEVPTVYKDHVAEAHLEHFSTYILLNKKEFDKVWDTEIRVPGDYSQEHPDCLDVVLVIDSSGSMYDNDRENIRLEAAKQFVDKLGEKDRAAVIDFDRYTSVLSEFTSDKTQLHSAISKVDDMGGTDLSMGISPAINMFTNDNYSNDAYRYIIMLTDGDGYYNSSLTNLAKENNIQIYTIGLGSGVQETVLKKIAEGTGGKYYFASQADELIQIYENTAMETIDYSTDSNGDGISDYYTRLIAEGKLRDGAGNCYFACAYTEDILDKNPDTIKSSELIYQAIQSNADFDGDGRRNGEEIIITQQENRVYIKMISNPAYRNSDTDPFRDDVEITMKGHPFEYDIKKYDLDFLTKNEQYPSALYADQYVEDAWYRAALGLGNYVFGGEYDWSYAAQKRLLKSIENYAKRLMEFYEESFTTIALVDWLQKTSSTVNDWLSLITGVTKPTYDNTIVREIEKGMVELDKMEAILSDPKNRPTTDMLYERAAECVNIRHKIEMNMRKIEIVIEKDYMGNYDEIKDELSEIKITDKLSFKMPEAWSSKVIKAGDILDKAGKVCSLVTATLDSADSLVSTINGYGAMAASIQTYGAVYNLLCELQENSSIGFVKVAAGDLKTSVESEYNKLISEISLMTEDVFYSFDEIAVDVLLDMCGTIGWAIGLGRSLANAITGVGAVAKQSIYMIAAGEAGKASAKCFASTMREKNSFYCRINDNTLEHMLLCGTLRIDAEKEVIETGSEQSWLFKKLNNFEDVESFCGRMEKSVIDTLNTYGLKGEIEE